MLVMAYNLSADKEAAKENIEHTGNTINLF